MENDFWRVAAGLRANSSVSSDETEKVSRHGSRDGHVEEGMKKRSRGSLKGFRSGLAQPGDERACKTCGREVMFVPIVWPVLELLYLQLLRVVSD